MQLPSTFRLPTMWGHRAPRSRLSACGLPFSHDPAKTRIVVRGVVTGLRRRRLVATADDSPRTTVAQPRCANRVLPVIPPRMKRQEAFPVEEHGTVTLVRKRTALMDQPVGCPGLRRQLGERDRRDRPPGYPCLDPRLLDPNRRGRRLIPGWQDARRIAAGRGHHQRQQGRQPRGQRTPPGTPFWPDRSVHNSPRYHPGTPLRVSPEFPGANGTQTVRITQAMAPRRTRIPSPFSRSSGSERMPARAARPVTIGLLG